MNLIIPKTLLTLSAILAQFPAMAQTPADIAGYWPLDADLIDASFAGGDGTFVDTAGGLAPTFTTAGVLGGTAQFGEAVQLTATNGEYISIDGAGNAAFAGENAYDFTGASMSVSVWASTTAEFTSSWQGLVGKGEVSGWRLSRLYDENSVAYAGGLGNTSAEATSDVTSGLHHFVAVTNKDRGIYLYVDGVLESFVPGAPFLEDRENPMAIGNNPDNLDRSWDGTIDDVILFNTPLTGPQVATLYNDGAGVSGAQILTFADTDADGIPDYYELANGLDPAIDDAAGDLDGDNLNNLDEFLQGLGANTVDGDGDGLLDGNEAANNGDPHIADTDGDGLSDGDEVHIHNTLVDNVDTDNDQASDFEEVTAGTSPTDNTDFPSSWSLGLKAYWNFDENLLDSSGSGAHGTYRTAVVDAAPVYNDGKFGKAISLDASNDEYVEILSVVESTFDFTGESMSASVWCSSAGFTHGWQAIMAKGEEESWRIARAAKTDEAAMNPGDWQAGGDDLRGGNIGDGGLHHIVIVVDKENTGQLWVDGVKVGETTLAPTLGNSASNLFIGANPDAPADGGFRSWNGQIDDVAIWNRPLSGSEIAQLYNAGDGAALETLINDSDSDFDGLPDSWENANGTNSFLDDAADDPDNDDRTNLQEFVDGTNPQNPDSDGDTLDDGAEAAAMTDPLDMDTDNDSLTDGAEVLEHMTDPLVADSDSDGFLDGVEIEFETDPNLASSFPPLEAGLLGYWAFDNDLSDGTGNGGDGTYVDNGQGDPNYVVGQFGSGILLDNANNQYVLVDGAGASTPPDYTQAGASVSISVWSSVTTFVANWQGLVARGEGTAWRIASRNMDGSPAGQYAFAGGTGDIFSPAGYEDGSFHHIVAVSEKGVNTRIYVDGVLAANSVAPPALTDNGNANLVTIGSNPDALARSWNGIIDDVGIWARPLSDVEILGIYSSTQSIGEQLGLGEEKLITVTGVTRNSASGVDLSWNSKDGVNYTVFATTDLSLPLASWDVIHNSIPSNGETTNFRVPEVKVNGEPKAFFVVKQN